MTEKMIRDAYVRIRTIDQTIPDEVLDFMKDASIEKLKQVNNNIVLADVRQRTFIVEEQISGADYWESVSVRLPTLERAREFVKNHAPEHIKERFRIVDVYVA